MVATLFNESHNDLTVLSQQAVNAIQTELLQTKMVFEEDALGASYRAALSMPAQYTVLTGSLLPVIDTATVVVTRDEVNTRFTGNALLIVRQLPPVAVTYDHDGDKKTADVEFLADKYRFEYIFLRKDNTSFARSGQSVDLMLSTSDEYADYFQLNALPAGNAGKIVTKLIAAGLARAWDPGKTVPAAFYALSGATDGKFDAALNNPSIAMTKTKTLLRGLLGAHISGKMNYSVAFQPASPKPQFPLTQPIPSFARTDASLPNYPSGFEVKMVGPAGNRQVVTRVMLMSFYRKNYETQQAIVTTAARF
jgi:hypothetical protein